MKKISISVKLLLFMICIAAAGCSGKEAAVAPHNPMGLSGKRPAAAETAFAKAHALWDKKNVCTNPSLAVEWLSEAIRLDPQYAAAYARRGLAKSELHDWDGGFDDLSKAIRLNPTAEVYAFRALVSLKGGNLYGARKDVEKSLAMTKKQHMAWNIRGMMNLTQGDREAACKDFLLGCEYGDCTGLEALKAGGECPR